MYNEIAAKQARERERLFMASRGQSRNAQGPAWQGSIWQKAAALHPKTWRSLTPSPGLRSQTLYITRCSSSAGRGQDTKTSHAFISEQLSPIGAEPSRSISYKAPSLASGIVNSHARNALDNYDLENDRWWVTVNTASSWEFCISHSPGHTESCNRCTRPVSQKPELESMQHTIGHERPRGLGALER